MTAFKSPIIQGPQEIYGINNKDSNKCPQNVPATTKTTSNFADSITPPSTISSQIPVDSIQTEQRKV